MEEKVLAVMAPAAEEKRYPAKKRRAGRGPGLGHVPGGGSRSSEVIFA